MEIKKGLVQWNGRNDIPCSYIDMEDGTKYYIKQDLVNGNHIVTTSLLEAVDSMAKVENMGLLDGDGNILIPTNNSSIKVLGDNLLLVEPAEAVSDNVKEAINLRMDPLSATRLVSTPAQIKEKINAKMSPEGRYVSNDQFKEGTLCDANGNNLLNGEYYSFVAKDNDKVFLAKNKVDTDVVEFSIADNKVIENTITPVKEEKVEVPVTENVVEENNKVGESVVPVVENSVPTEEVTDLGEETSIPDVNKDFSFDITEETPTEVVNTEENTEVENPTETVEEADLEKRLSELNEKYSGINNMLSQYENNNEVSENTLQDVFSKTDFKVDSIDDIDEEVKEDTSSEEELNDTTVKEFVNAFEELRQENANKDRELNEARVIIEKQKDTAAKDKARIKSLEQKNELATSTINDLREALAKQSAEAERAKNAADIYKGKADGYKYELAEKDREIERLKSQDKALDYIRDTLERYKAAKDIDNIYKDIDEEDSFYKVA